MNTKDPLFALLLASGAPPPVVRAAYWQAQLIHAVRELSTIGHFANLIRLDADHFVAPVTSEWGLTLTWDYDRSRANVTGLEQFDEGELDEG